jgi:hypothetical protein
MMKPAVCFRVGVWQFFTTVCSNNLHIGLCMSPLGDILRNHCHNFPGLINNTSIDWLFPWPRQALVAVASVFLAEVMNSLIVPTTFVLKVKTLSQFYVLCHESSRNYAYKSQCILKLEVRVRFVTSLIYPQGKK